MKLKPLWSILILVVLLSAGIVAPRAVAQDDMPREETFRIGMNARIADPTNLNLYASGVDRTIGLHQLIYEYFFYYNLQTGEFIPWLAESYEYDADSTGLTVKIRDGVTWSDGQPFTSDDVVFTYDTLLANPSMTWAETVTKWVKSVEAVDATNVHFTLTEANPRFHLLREAFPAVGIWGGVTILPKHIWEGQDPVTFTNSEAIGTGAYKLRDASQTAMTYERRDDWWGVEAFGVTPGPRFIQFAYVGTEQNVALALASNEIDTPDIGVLSAGSFLEVSSQNANVRAWTEDAPYSWPDPCPRALMVQNATPPLDKPEVRWAINHVIDREQLVELAYEGTTTPAWGVWPEYDANTPYFEAIADLREQYPTGTTDTDRARQLLEEVGVNPEDITLRYLVDSDSNEEMKNSEVISDQLEAFGFNVEIQTLAGGPMADTIRRGDYDIKQHSFCPGYIVENLDLFHSKHYVPLGELAVWYEVNSFRYQNPELDTIIDQMYATPPDDEAALVELYKQAMAIWLRDLPVVPIVQAPALVPFNSTYWTGWPTAEDPWNMPVNWWATMNTVVIGYPDASGNWVGGLKPASGS